MKELTMNEITNVYGGCNCNCKKDDECQYIGHASGIKECYNVCTAMGMKMCNCV